MAGLSRPNEAASNDLSESMRAHRFIFLMCLPSSESEVLGEAALPHGSMRKRTEPGRRFRPVRVRSSRKEDAWRCQILSQRECRKIFRDGVRGAGAVGPGSSSSHFVEPPAAALSPLLAGREFPKSRPMGVAYADFSDTLHCSWPALLAALSAGSIAGAAVALAVRV